MDFFGPVALRLHRLSQDEEGGWWPCSSAKCKNRDRDAWERRISRGEVADR